MKSTLMPKIIPAMKGYTKQQLLKDIVAGIIVAVIAFPLSVALAISSGMSPERGLYTAIIGGFLVSLFGGSKVNIGGATAATVMTVFTIIANFGLAGLAIATIIAGILLIIMGLLKAGTLLRYIPRTITLGFTAAIGMGIFSSQLKGFFGFQMESIPVNTIDKFVAYSKVLDTLDLTTLGIGLLAMVVLIVVPKISPKIPNSLVAILVTTPIVLFFNLDVPTIRSVYGELPSHFPKIELPQFSWSLVVDVIPSAVTLAILIAIVSLLSCVVTDGLMGEPHDSNQELIAEGIANIFCGLFGAVPVAGAVARSSTSVKTGGRTPIAGIVHSLVVTLILLFMLPLAGFIPMPTLAAILILVAYNMCNFGEIITTIKRAPISDTLVLLTTFGAGVIVNLLFAVEVGVLASAVLFLKRMSEVTNLRQWENVTEANPDPENPDQLKYKPIPENTLVYEIEGPVFFATVDELIAGIKVRSKYDAIILRMRNVPAIDITAIRSLEALLELCNKKNVHLVFSHVNEQPWRALEKAGYIDKVGRENFCVHIDAALAKAEEYVTKSSDVA
ncbi:MAG: SulP family inorganic anion transporter [Lachnospiraceae bacterium]|nr:SulP family inorganic anion transporter [Lachnospiraceae bacterium]